ncbi:MAG: pilus assembly protein PilP [Kofleriaceae bacterium]
MKLLRLGALGLSLGLVGACGEDEEAAPPPPPRAATPAAPRTAVTPAVGKTNASDVATYTHVEERLTTDAERSTIRHQFRESDFIQDADGENRDPFRSFILASGLLDQRPGLPLEASDVCSARQMVATNYSIRDLKLVGIVARGLRRYALMQDTANLGQIVTRGDCVGKEKARVKEIGAGYVTLEVMPDIVAEGTPRVAEERSIPLYPEELPIARELDEGAEVVTPPAPVVLPAEGGGAAAPPSPPAKQ